MAESRLSLAHDGERRRKIRQATAAVLPEWQVFIRRPDGRGEHFVFTRRRQTILLASVAAVTLWATVVTVMLSRQPAELEAKERHLEEMMASYRSAQHRLASAHKMVGDITREIDTVHTNLLVLAESSATLASDRPARNSAVLPKVRVGGDPVWDDDLPGSVEAKKVREQVHQLETALDRLKVTYSKVVQNTADHAGQRIADAEQSVRRLGLDPERLEASQSHKGGQGGPFIPLTGGSGLDTGLGTLVERMDHWDTIKASLQTVPLAEPLHTAFEINSAFGVRNDPLNSRNGIHEGVDLGAPYGTPVFATASGVVKMAGPYDRYGLTIDIDHGNGLVTRYAHLSRIKAQVGQKVTRSTVIGHLGNSGRSTGAHLHYEVRVGESPRDPLKFISVGRDAPKAR